MNLTRDLASTQKTGSANFKCFHNSDIRRINKVADSGFTLIETLIVVLVLGILCATGVSIYAGTTGDSQLRSLTDEIQSFFTACRHRAVLRKTPVKIIYRNYTLSTDPYSALRLRIPELTEASVEKIDGMIIKSPLSYNPAGKNIQTLSLQILLPGDRPATISVEL